MNIADIAQRAVNQIVSEYGHNTETGNGFWYVWKDGQRGQASASDGFTYLREGVMVKLDDCTVIVRAVSNNGLNCGEAKLTGFAATNHDLIQGVIETALESI